MSKFFMTSGDYLLGSKIYDCIVNREVISNNKKLNRKNFYLVNISAPLFNDKPDFLNIREFLIFSRFEKKIDIYSKNYPLYVFLAHIKPDYDGEIEKISSNDLILDITAELYDTFEKAEQAY